MRLHAVEERLRNQRSRLTTINGALLAAGEPPLDTRPLDNRVSWVARTLRSRSAA
jgi:hypothetical protein